MREARGREEPCKKKGIMLKKWYVVLDGGGGQNKVVRQSLAGLELFIATRPVLVSCYNRNGIQPRIHTWLGGHYMGRGQWLRGHF